jgi:hypothetical protein
VRERSGVDFGGGVLGRGVLEQTPKKERKKEKKVESKNGVAYTADHAKNQILVA